MRGPSLQKTALLSFSLHLTAFLLIFLILRQSNHIVIPSPYTVNLVSPNVLRMNKGKIENIVKESEETASPLDSTEKSRKEAAEEKEFVKKKIAALQQKENVEKKISDLAAKKNKKDALAKLQKIISLKAGGDKHGADSKIISSSAGKGAMFADYYAKITNEIQQHWVYPDTGRKDIEAIVSVKISRDGTAVAQKIEKSSGNVLFDKSALKAIAKANPLSPPPYEMEIGVRFNNAGKN